MRWGSAPFLAALALAGCGGGSDDPAPTPPPDVAVTLELAKAEVSQNEDAELRRFGSRSKLTGRATRDGSAAKGVQVLLHGDPFPYGDATKLLDRARTDSRGRFTLRPALELNTRLEAQVEDAGRSLSMSSGARMR